MVGAMVVCQIGVVDITVCSFDEIFDEADHFFKLVALDEMGAWLSTRERF